MPTSPFGIRFEEDTLAVTFEGLIKRTPLIKQIRALLEILQEKLGMPADIEFAFDGIHLYLLQCRAQSYSKDILPSPIPKNIPKEKIVFSANRYVSNGFVPDISFIVYVDPLAYNQLSDLSELNNVGRAIGKLNMILPKSQFILMGPLKSHGRRVIIFLNYHSVLTFFKIWLNHRFGICRFIQMMET